MKCPTTGSIASGLGFRERVCDTIDRFNFPEDIKDDAKRISFDLPQKHTAKKTAVISLFLSSQLNAFDFRKRLAETIKIYNDDDFFAVVENGPSIRMFLSRIKRDATGFEYDFSILERMHKKLEDTSSNTESQSGSLLLSSPDTQSQGGS